MNQTIQKILKYENDFTDNYKNYNDYGFILGSANSYFEEYIFEIIRKSRRPKQHVVSSVYNKNMKCIVEHYCDILPVCLQDIIYKYVRRYVEDMQAIPMDIPLSPVSKSDIHIDTNLFITTEFCIGYYKGILKRKFSDLKFLALKTTSELMTKPSELAKYDIVLITIETYYILNIIVKSQTYRWNRIILDNLDFCFYYGIYEVGWLCSRITLQKANFTWFLGSKHFNKRDVSFYFNNVLKYDYAFNIAHNGLRITSESYNLKTKIFTSTIYTNSLSDSLHYIVEYLRYRPYVICYVILRSDTRLISATKILNSLIREKDAIKYYIVSQSKRFDKHSYIIRKRYNIILDTEINTIKNNDFSFVTDIFCLDETLLDTNYNPCVERCLGINRTHPELTLHKVLPG